MTSQNDSVIFDTSKKFKRTARDFFTSIPTHLKITTVIFIISIVIHVSAINSSRFADFFTENIASIFRSVLATVTGILPFSIAETFVLMLPVLLFVYFAFTWNYYIHQNHSLRPLIYAVLSVLISLYSVAVFTFLTGYSNSTLDKKLDLDKQPVTSIELYETAKKVHSELTEIQATIEYEYGGSSRMPYKIQEMSRKLLDSYDTCKQMYPFLHNIKTQIKPIALSEAMSYTHITGVYTYFTGEANIDAAFPDFTLPYTAAHEFAHQRGIAREDEANFVAYLVCVNSTDNYIRYSGYMNMLQYLLNALYTADRDLYSQFYSEVKSKTKGELKAYSSFFDKYRDSTASKVSGAVNDTYLKLQGTEGSKSYGMVVDLAVAYYKTDNAPQ